MKMNKKAFTLVEMLFVVVIALMALGFSAYKLTEMKTRGYDKGATGFLVDIAGAKAAMSADLARQGGIGPEGMDLDSCIRNPASGITENIEITVEGIQADPDEGKGKTLAEYLSENNCSKDSILKALGIFGYLKYGISTVGNYKYYLYAGFPVSAQCGAMTQELDDHTIAYMCGKSHRSRVHSAYKDDTRCQVDGGIVYLDNGDIRTRGGGGLPTVLTDPNPCASSSSAVMFRCAPLTQEYTFDGYQASCPSTAPFYGIDSPVIGGQTPQYTDCFNVGTPSANHGPDCKTTCKYDSTVANNTQSDDVDGAAVITIVDPEDETGQATKEITCYDYWHYWGAASYQ